MNGTTVTNQTPVKLTSLKFHSTDDNLNVIDLFPANSIKNT